MKLRLWVCIVVLTVLGAGACQKKSSRAASVERVRLPNGWSLTPAGRQVELGGLPLRLLTLSDNKNMLVMSNGYTEHFIGVVDIDTEKIVQRVAIPQGFLGLVASPDGRHVYASAGGNEQVRKYRVENGRLTLETEMTLPSGAFPAGLAIAPDGKKLYAAGNLGEALYEVDLDSNKVLRSIPVGAKPYACALSKDARTAYVSNWGEDTVSVIDLASGSVKQAIKVRHKPNDMLLTADGNRLFVAIGNWSVVAVIDTKGGRVTEEIDVGLAPNSPPGTTPNALALSADQKTLYVANADNNAVAVIDISNPDRSVPKGFIPTGWYPTSVALSNDGKKMVVANGKGISSSAMPKEKYLAGGKDAPSIHTLLEGTLSFIDMPEPQELAEYSQSVHQNSPYSTPRENEPRAPFALGESCPIRYVFYIIKENRTYDQILGDMKEGNGDPEFCLFPEKVTPNHHALARQFVLMDNLYHDAEVSADGHHWVMSAYATDYVEKLWPSTYSKRGGRGLRPDYHDDAEAYSAGGFLWDRAAEAGITYRSYGEFARRQGAEPGKVRPATPSLAGHIHPTYLGASGLGPGGSSNEVMSDMDRFRLWREEFQQFEKKGEMPRLTILSLPGDHTLGTRPGARTPQAMVAENDLALGHIVETLSRSRFWKSLAIFVIEDDTQGGPDHVDVHRTVGYVIGPHVRRKAVDSTMYSSSSMLKTIGQILGLRPLTQYDASAMPMWNAFQAEPDLTPYTALPARVSLVEKNTATAYGAKRSLELNLDEADSAPDQEFNEILWKAVKGRGAELPPRRVAAFVAPTE